MSGHHKELLRTNLWLVPAIEVLAALGLFAVTYALDRAAYHGDFALPSWVISGSADAARQILTTIAAAIITVVGVVFSIVIVALTLVSTQFGPRMLRNFIRDRGTQLTLGTFVATFVYAVLALVSIGGRAGTARSCRTSASPSRSALTVADLAVLIYFIHHIATQIQLPQVIAGISADLSEAIDDQVGDGAARPGDPPAGRPAGRHAGPGRRGRWPRTAATCSTSHRRRCCGIAEQAGAVIYLRYRPGHFLVQGSPLATVWPASAAGQVAASWPGRTSPARTGRWPRTSRSASTSWWRSRSARCPPRSTTRSRR